MLRAWRTIAFFTLLASNSVVADIRDDIREAIQHNQLSQAQDRLDQWLKANPADDEHRFLLAQVLSWRNDISASKAIVDQLITRYPLNTDYLLLKGRLLSWENNHDGAILLLEKARTISPEYFDIWDLELKILANFDRTSLPIHFSELSQAFAQRFPDKDIAAYTRKHKPLRIVAQFAYQYENISNSDNDWTEYSSVIGARVREKHDLTFHLAEISRYGLQDQQYGLDYHLTLPTKTVTGISYSKSNEHVFLPRWAISLDSTQRINEHWLGSIRLGNREYNNTDVISLTASAEYQFPKLQVSYALLGSLTDQEHLSTTHTLHFRRSIFNTFTSGASISYGDEMEVVSPNKTLFYRIFSARIYGEAIIQQAIKFQVSILYHQQGNAYERTGFNCLLQYAY